MRTIYRVSRKNPGTEQWAKLPDAANSLQQAFAAAGRPEQSDWFLWDGPRWRLTDEVRSTSGEDIIITPERLPDTLEDRVELTVELLMDYRWFDGAHHKQWVIDQAVRTLLGDRYEARVAEWCDGEDGPDTYSWDTGIAP